MDSYYCGFPLGKELWGKKYKDENDFTILDTWKRVAKAVASVENPEDRQKWYDAFLDILVTGKFIPGGRITAGAGTKHNYLLNCCVIGVKDSLAEIYESVKKAAILAKSNYGVGMNFSKLRPKNAGLSSGGIATGPVSFMKVFDASGSVIQTGGGRRAAQIAVLNISHPDIEEFIDAKHQEGVLTQFNISVGISYAFLDAVEKNESWDLYFNGKVYKTVRAKDLWEKLCKSGYLFNDPGFLFIDEVNKWSNSLYLYEMDCVNPCLHPDSMIETVHGRVKIKDITEPIMVYTCMPDGSLGIKMASASWISKRNAETLVIETANGKKVRCTPDHRILTQDMEWKEAKDLKLGDRVVQLNRRRRGVAYSGVKLTTESVESMRMEHRFIADGVWGISDSDDVHHIDGDTYNNDIDNLEILSHSDHSKYTAINDNPQSHQVVDSLGRFISTGISKKTVIPMPEDLRSNMKHGWSNSIVSISAGEITDVYDITVEDTHNLIADFTVVHNCGEITLPEDGVCCLGNINMTKFVKQPFATTGYTHIYDDTWNFDLHSYYETIDVAVRFLDNVLTLSEYPYPEMKYRAQSERRIGLNPISGLGSTLAMLCLPYDSKDALDFTEHICKEAMNASYMTSSNLAIEKGSFEKYHSDFCKGLFVRTLDDDVRNHIYKHGIRNIALLTVPPVGTGSLIAGNISNGLEPIFSLEYTRKVRQDDGSLKEECVDDYAWRMWKQKQEDAAGMAIDFRSIEKPKYFKTSMQISPKAHINMQALIQKYIDNSLSKTCNLPEETTFEEYQELLWYAIKSGVKGFTTFRSGTREGVLNEKKKDDSGSAKEGVKVLPIDNVHTAVVSSKGSVVRERVLDGKTYQIKDDTKKNTYITINSFVDDGVKKPWEIFLFSKSAHSEWYAAMGVLMSSIMRKVGDVHFIIDDLKDISGDSGYFTPEYGFVGSKPAHIGYILEEYINNLNGIEKAPSMSHCPSCKEMSLVREGGCNKCQSCGYSDCG